MRLLIFFIFAFPSTDSFSQTQFKRYKPCSFSISLPKGFSIKPMEKESNFDYCDYIVKTVDRIEVMQLHSLLASRYMNSDIKTLYAIEQKMEDINIIYQLQKANWFVISGTDKKTGHLLYRKTVVGERFVSELRIDYAKDKATKIEPFIPKIAASFTSD
jgi:hypothetical protein